MNCLEGDIKIHLLKIFALFLILPVELQEFLRFWVCTPYCTHRTVIKVPYRKIAINTLRAGEAYLRF